MFALTLTLTLALHACSDDGRVSPDGEVGPDGPASDAEKASDGAGRDGPAADGPVVAADGAGEKDGAVIAAFCPKLPAPGGAVTKVKASQAQQLPGIVSAAKNGTTILLEDGTYVMTGTESQRRLNFSTPGVTLRSASGDRDKVIIDGQYKTKEIIFIRASDVTIADLTIKRAEDHPIHVTGGAATIKNTLLYNLKIIDGGEQFVKVNSSGTSYADQGRLECSWLEMTAAGRPHVESCCGGCYTGGIDTHGGWGWKVRYNSFKGIYCDNGGLAEHAVHFWSASRDTLVERNTIINCARGVGFGLGSSGKDRAYPDKPYPSVGYKGHIDGVIRNNVIHTDPGVAKYYDTGIELNQAHGAGVYHNTVITKPTFSSIDYRFANTKAVIRNNLTYKITIRDNAKGTVDHNLPLTPTSLFKDAAKVDYHLLSSASQAIDKGVIVTAAGLDMDGKQHNVGVPDLGAHEHRP